MSFAFVVGSFACTAPFLRALTSDIDVLVSVDLDDDTTIRELVMARYPSLSKDVVIDRSVRVPRDGVITFKHAWWQLPQWVSLVPSSVTLQWVPTPIDVPNALRHPDKQVFIDYARNCDVLDFYRLDTLPKAIQHYGVEAFWDVVNSLPERDVFEWAVSFAENRLPHQ